jgi:hypothetical protein
MSDTNATIVGFVLSFSILLGYALWLAIELSRVMKAVDARNRSATASFKLPQPTESVATELKPYSRIKTS